MSALWNFIVANQAYLLGLVALIVNEIFAANPNLKSNSLVQFILSLVGLMPKSLQAPPK